MAKDPAFLFYSSDFLTGTMSLSFEDRGKYITLLSLMHQQGRMDEKKIRFLVGEISADLQAKFSVDNQGFWFNKRLELEADRRNKFCESRRKSRSFGAVKGKKKKDKHTSPRMSPHTSPRMENEIVDKIRDKDKRGGAGGGNGETLFVKCKKKFLEVVPEYYFEGKDGNALKGLIQKIEFRTEDPSDEKVLAGFGKYLEHAKRDKWIRNNFSLTILNSKFNELTAKPSEADFDFDSWYAKRQAADKQV